MKPFMTLSRMRRFRAGNPTASRPPSGRGPWRRLLLVYLLISGTGMFGLIVGLHDAISSWYTAQLFGIALALFGAVAFSGGALAVGSWRRSLGFLQWATPVAALFIACSMLVTHLLNLGFWAGLPQRFWYLVSLWVLVAIAASWAIYVDWRDDGLEWPRRKLVKNFSAIVTFTGVAAALQFWYTAAFVPFEAAPALSVQTDMQPAGRSGNLVAIRASVTVRNTSSAKVVVLASRYRMTAAKVKPRQPYLSGKDQQNSIVAAAKNSSATDSLSTETNTQLVKTGPVLPSVQSFDRAEEFHETWLTEVPRDQFDAVTLTVDFVVAKDNVLQLDLQTQQDAFAYPAQSHMYLAKYTDISESSWVRRLIGPSHTVVEVWRIDDNGAPPADPGEYLSVYVMSEGSARDALRDNTKSVAKFYGLAQTSSHNELSLWDLSKTP